MIDYRGTPGPCPSSIPWELIEPYERQALINHDQTLKRLAERGGLGPSEALLVMTGRTWGKVEDVSALEKEACAFLDKLVRESQVVRLSREVRRLREALTNIDAMRKRLPDPDFAEQRTTAAGIGELVKAALKDEA